MAKIIVYNNDTDRMETYYRDLTERMPYNYNKTLTVQEFRGASNSDTLWTTKKTMKSWNSQRRIYGAPIPVGFAFRRPWEGGHGNQSQHYAGTAFDVAQGWTNAQRAVLRNSARNSGLWSYVEPISISPTWVHFDRRQFPPACLTGGYPLLKRGNLSVYVLIAQDDLNTLGFTTGGLDGIFGNNTFNAVRDYQSSRGLTPDGIIGCNTWRSLQENVVGTGRTSTTID
ncbi:MAG: peptidoglycan-binding protein [Clostridiales bacterium]|nr:peptidoglycan-binding protein [Clostridiales bacterium]